MSAPASTQAATRSSAASRPSAARASVRAMITNSGSVLASAAARQIDGLEADALRHPRGVGVDAADDLQRPLGGDRRAEARAGGRAHAHDHTTGGDGLPGGAGLGPTARLDSPG